MKQRLIGAGYVLLLAVAPMAAALWAGGTTIPGGWFEPWDPAMIDLDVYRRTGALLLQGQDFYNVPNALPWIYPAFAAVLTVPFALVSPTFAQVGWLALNVLMLLAILYRLGLKGWRLSVAATAVVWLVQPVREALGFGQLGVFLVGAAVLDSMPGPRVLSRRLLPEGWLTGLVTAIKLTPAVVAVYNFLAGKRRAGIVSFITFAVATVVGFVVVFGMSVLYWTKLLSGDSGLNSGIIFKSNQSVLGVWDRTFGELSRGGLLACAVVLVLGVAAAVLLHRLDQVPLALSVAGLTSLLASPISWSHHYVWIVPLGVILLQDQLLPLYVRVSGLFYAIWVAFAPFEQLPGGDGQEAHYPPFHMLVANLGVYAGVAFLVLVLVAALGPWGRERRAELARRV